MPFFGMSIASEQEVIYIVSKQENEKNIIRAIMEKAGSRQDRVAAVFSLPDQPGGWPAQSDRRIAARRRKEDRPRSRGLSSFFHPLEICYFL